MLHALRCKFKVVSRIYEPQYVANVPDSLTEKSDNPHS